MQRGIAPISEGGPSSLARTLPELSTHNIHLHQKDTELERFAQLADAIVDVVGIEVVISEAARGGGIVSDRSEDRDKRSQQVRSEKIEHKDRWK